MYTTLFLQSETRDPYQMYEAMLNENPVYRDDSNKLWAIYSYQSCREILNNPVSAIPSFHDNKDELNDYARLISGRLSRLSNGAEHEIARRTVTILFDNMKKVSTGSIVNKLIEKENNKHKLDWVDSICKKLPVAVVLKSFDFTDEDVDYILNNIEQFVKIMAPSKTSEQIVSINNLSREFYLRSEKWLTATDFYKTIFQSIASKYKIDAAGIVFAYVSNLIGLIIQSYDAGRGILSNALLQVIRNNSMPTYSNRKIYFEKSVIETLRFDPPVHNTRRIAMDDMILDKNEIKKGDQLLLVLAAANRDPTQFDHPCIYDIERKNNEEHLTFGAGVHKCPANQLSITLATETLSWLFEKYKAVRLLETNIQYEPTINTRLPINISISLS